MTAPLERPATRRCVRIFDDNYNLLQTVARANQISRDALIRHILDAHCRKLKALETKALQSLDVISIETSDLDFEELDLGGK